MCLFSKDFLMAQFSRKGFKTGKENITEQCGSQRAVTDKQAIKMESIAHLNYNSHNSALSNQI